MTTITNPSKLRSNALWKLREPERQLASECRHYVKRHRPKAAKTVGTSARRYRRQVLGLPTDAATSLIDDLWTEFKQKCFDLMLALGKRQRDVREEAIQYIRTKGTLKC